MPTWTVTRREGEPFQIEADQLVPLGTALVFYNNAPTIGTQPTLLIAYNDWVSVEPYTEPTIATT